MRTRSMFVLGLFLSVAACTVESASQPSGAEADPSSEDPSKANGGGEGATGASATGEAANGNEGSEPSAPTDGDAGAGATDAGADASKPKIPAPTFGYLHAYTNTGETCEFSIEGVYKSTGKVLDTVLAPDAYTIGCKRTNGTTVEEAAIITTGQTTNLVFDFQIIPKPVFDSGAPAMGYITAVAVGGSCEFSFDGVSAGSGATIKKEVTAGTHQVSCKPVSGATKSRSVTVSEGSTAMAMFKL